MAPQLHKVMKAGGIIPVNIVKQYVGKMAFVMHLITSVDQTVIVTTIILTIQLQCHQCSTIKQNSVTDKAP
jgi:hypothetical protein